MPTRREVLLLWEKKFASAEIDSPRLSAQVLLAHVLHLDRFEMLLHLAEHVPQGALHAFQALAHRRAVGEPLAYLLRTREFYSYSFRVTPDVLIPRPETETLVDLVRGVLPVDARASLVDIGTGSGAIAVTLAMLFPHLHLLATDISRSALNVARWNARSFGVEGRIDFVQADLLAGIDVAQIDVFVANLPYVPTSMRPAMSREVLDFEPWLALFAGTTGVDLYARLAEVLGTAPRKGAILFCEIDASQERLVPDFFSRRGHAVRVGHDYAGRPRFVVVNF